MLIGYSQEILGCCAGRQREEEAESNDDHAQSRGLTQCD